MSKEDIYNAYFKGDIKESELIISLDSIQEKTVKGDGVIYTPWNIVEKMIEIANPSKDMKIIEPSCGHGIFLIGLLYFMKKKYSLSSVDLLDWFKEKVIGIEISQNTVKEAKEILSAYFKKHFDLNIHPNNFSNIQCEDGLKVMHQDKIDLCIGNPPYIRAKHLEKEYLSFIKTTYASCAKGTIDIYYAFIERYLLISKSLVFITPNSFLTTKAGYELRNQILNKIDYLIDFKEKKVFRDASVYTCIFKANNDSSNRLIYGNDLENTKIFEKHEFWNKATNDEGIFKNILSGIATLSDSVYLVKKKEDGKYYASFNNILYEVEEGMVVPYLKLTKIKSNDDLSKHDYMIYPYDMQNKSINEDVLKNKFPLTYRYLLVAKEKLLQRDKGKTEKYEKWYSYGRKQGLHEIKGSSVISIPLMIGGSCLPIRLNIANLIRKYKRIVFTSGYIVPEEHNEDKLINYDSLLSKEFIEFAQSYGKVWPGKDENYFTLKSKQIKTFNPKNQ